MTMLDAILGVTERPYLDRVRARPFVKWAGGKRSLIPDIARRLPERMSEIYWEPFVGGGAVFFALDSLIGNARLYAEPPFVIHEVSAPRNINCKAGERGDAGELLITTYEPPVYDTPAN